MRKFGFLTIGDVVVSMAQDGRKISRGTVRAMDDVESAKGNPIFGRTNGDWRMIPVDKLKETKLRIWTISRPKDNPVNQEDIDSYRKFLYGE